MKLIFGSEEYGSYYVAERHRPVTIRKYFDGLWAGPQLPTDQDRMLVGLLSNKRLLEFIRFFILFDQKIGKVRKRAGIRLVLPLQLQRYSCIVELPGCFLEAARSALITADTVLSSYVAVLPADLLGPV